MARDITITCDACSKDITQGDGVLTRVICQSEHIVLKPGTTMVDPQPPVIEQKHFCDVKCLGKWAMQQADPL